MSTDQTPIHPDHNARAPAPAVMRAPLSSYRPAADVTLTWLRAAEERIALLEARVALLERLSSTDELTGLLNRRGLALAFRQHVGFCARGLSAGGLFVIIDLDNFKAINDNHGHPAGDCALRLVGQTLREDIRAMDSAARLGGDEFVLLLSHTTKRDAASRAQRLGWKLNNLALAWEGDIVPIRASLGLKTFGGSDDFDMIFAAADAGLSACKAELRRNTDPYHERNRGATGHDA